MRKISYTHLFILISVICLMSCSTKGFFTRKNHQPRVQIQAQKTSEELELVPTASSSPLHVKEEIHIKEPKKSIENTRPNIFYKILSTFYPKQKNILDKVYVHPKLNLGSAKPTEGDDRTTGLIINLLALAFGIAAIFMVIGVVHGSVWVYFVVGMILAAAAIIMGFIGKGMSWRGFGWLAGVIGIIAVVLLLIFMVLVVVVHTTF